MIKDYRTTIGGAFSALGVTLMGFGLVPVKTSDNIDMLKWMTVTGFICTALGTFFGHLFSADSREVKALTETVNDNTRALMTGDKTKLVAPPATLGQAVSKLEPKKDTAFIKKE